MTTYKEIKGTTIQNLAADLASSAAEGQIWFNTVSGDLKTIVKVAGSWASGGNLNTARGKGFAVGIQTASLQVGGEGPPPGDVGNVEQYNGSTWSEIADLNTAREQMGGSGTTTSALIFGGQTPVVGVAESWNGTSWTEVGDLNTARRGTTGAGASNSSALCSSGYDGTANVAVAETYDGSSWTEVGDVNTARRNHAGGGADSTSAMIMTGYDGSNSTVNCETWDGSSWTEIANVNAARDYAAGSPVGSGAGLVFAGTGVTAATEFYNGASWTEGSDLSTARQGVSGSGTTSLSLCSGGLKPPGTTLQTATEEWNQTSTLKTGAWASGGNLPNPSQSNTGFGPGTAGVHAGGELSGSANAEAFHYDGSSWTAGGNINQTRNVLGGYGTQTSGAIVGGHMDPTPTTVQNVHETYDGTTWSEAGDLQTGRAYFGTAGCGTTTAALVMAGLINPELNPHPLGAVGAKNESEEYDGTSWAEGNNVNTARVTVGGAGTQTAALLISGNTETPNALKTEVESYDGTSWTEVGDVNSAVDRIPSMAGGTQDVAIKVSGRVGLGDPNPTTANVEQWDGTSWAEVANVSTARFHGGVGSAPSASSAFLSGGTPPTTNATEEWTLEQNIKTIAD